MIFRRNGGHTVAMYILVDSHLYNHITGLPSAMYD
jgi:hypothetical protein